MRKRVAVPLESMGNPVPMMRVDIDISHALKTELAQAQEGRAPDR